jgi:hypothetical protein
MQYPAVRMGIRRLAKRLETDKPFAKKVKRVEKMLFVKDVIPIGQPFCLGRPVQGGGSRIDVLAAPQ